MYTQVIAPHQTQGIDSFPAFTTFWPKNEEITKIKAGSLSSLFAGLMFDLKVSLLAGFLLYYFIVYLISSKVIVNWFFFGGLKHSTIKLLY